MIRQSFWGNRYKSGIAIFEWRITWNNAYSPLKKCALRASFLSFNQLSFCIIFKCARTISFDIFMICISLKASISYFFTPTKRFFSSWNIICSITRFRIKSYIKKFRNKKFTPQYHLNACDSGCLLHVRSTVFHNCTTSTYSGSRRVLVFFNKNYGQSLRSKTTTG